MQKLSSSVIRRLQEVEIASYSIYDLGSATRIPLIL